MATKTTKAWLCEDHWERCLRHEPCDTCPSNPANKEAVEALSKINPEESALLNSALIKRMQELTEQLEGDRNGVRGLVTRVSLIEERMKWQRTSMEQWLGRLAILATTAIAMAALLVSLWDMLLRN